MPKYPIEKLRPKEASELKLRASMHWLVGMAFTLFLGLVYWAITFDALGHKVILTLITINIVGFGWAGLRFWRDYRNGKVYIKEGKVDKKEKRSMKSGLKPEPVHYLYWVTVNGKRISLSEAHYNSLSEGQEIKLRQAPITKFTLEID